MVKIPAIVYLIIGAIVTAGSMYIEGLTIFFYVGLIFIAVGVFKVVIAFVTKPKESAVEKQAEGIQQQQRQSAQRGIKTCPRCGAGSYPQANYCYYCGNRI